VAQSRWSLGSQGINALQRLAQHVLVKEKNGVERLILSAGRQIAPAGECGQKAFELFLAGKRIGHGVESRHVMAQPVNITGFSGKGLVLTS
jgi:hypothetical protein